jgi:hypothetical protein
MDGRHYGRPIVDPSGRDPRFRAPHSARAMMEEERYYDRDRRYR